MWCIIAEEGGGHLVSFVANDEVPIGAFEFGLDVFIAAELIEAADDEVVFGKPVTRPRRFEFVVGEDIEGELKAAI